MEPDTTTVAHLLEAAGFTPPPDEVAELATDYQVVRAMVAMLYTVDEARYESPALGFDPDPRFVDWA
jgi:hypothetical protein